MAYSAETPSTAKAASVGLPQITIAATTLSIVLIAGLHVLKPDFSPAWRFLSESAIGQYGWVMQLAFFSMAAASAVLATALWRYANTMVAKIGLVLHWIAALSMVGGGVFVMDPITGDPAVMTTHGILHAMTAMLGIPGLFTFVPGRIMHDIAFGTHSSHQRCWPSFVR
jgi:uncharacterized membrane protein